MLDKPANHRILNPDQIVAAEAPRTYRSEFKNPQKFKDSAPKIAQKVENKGENLKTL